jgi:hypothetical protein
LRRARRCLRRRDRHAKQRNYGKGQPGSAHRLVPAMERCILCSANPANHMSQDRHGGPNLRALPISATTASGPHRSGRSSSRLAVSLQAYR